MQRAWIAAALLTLASAWVLFTPEGELRLRIETSVDSLVADRAGRPAGPPVLLALLETPAALGAEDIAELARITRLLAREADVLEVESPATVSLPTVEGEDVVTSPLLDRLARNPEAASDLIERAVADPLLSGRLFGLDGRAAAIVIRMKPVPDAEVVAAAGRIRDRFRELAGESGRFRSLITGAPLVKSEVTALVRDNLRTVVLLSLAIAPVVLCLAFQGVLNILLPIVTVGLAVGWTLAAMVLLDIPVNLVTAIVPPLVLALSLGYSIHAMQVFAETRSPRVAMREMALPLSLSGVTTIAGLLSLSIQPLTAIRQFGVASSLGVVLGLLAVATVLCPAVLLRRGGVVPRPLLARTLGRLATLRGSDTAARRRRIVLAGLALLVVGLAGSLRVTPGTHYVRDLPADHPVRLEFETINRTLGGANSFEIVLTGAGPDAVLLPAVLRASDDLQQWLNGQPDIAGTTSLTDFLKRLHQVLNGGDPEEHRVPDSLATIKQLLFVAAPPSIYQFTDLAFTRLVIQVRTPLDETADLARLFEQIERRFQALPNGISAQLQGDLVSLTRIVEQLTSDQVFSIALAGVAIFAVLALVFGSFSAALRALLPNAVPVSLFYGIVGFAGIPLGPTTALVTCIVFGTTVDNTLFYLVRFSRSARRVANEEQAARDTLREVINPVTLTASILCLCLLTLTTSPFHSQTVFAVLAALTLAIAWFSDLTLTPAVAANSGIVTLWDVLRLDLGRKPEQTIPLFHDMTPRQARVFALLSRIEEMPGGRRFIRAGEEGHEMYVVVNGEVRASLARDGKEVELGRFQRGDTLGEAGSFTRRRTADVTAVTDARLLVFDAQDLERLRKRYPAIAALAFRNLNRIQAERLARTTRRLHEAVSGTPAAAG